MKFPTKSMVAFWVILAGFNFFVFSMMQTGFRFFALAMVIFCVWRCFAILKTGERLDEAQKQLEESKDKEEEF